MIEYCEMDSHQIWDMDEGFAATVNRDVQSRLRRGCGAGIKIITTLAIMRGDDTTPETRISLPGSGISTTKLFIPSTAAAALKAKEVFYH